MEHENTEKVSRIATNEIKPRYIKSLTADEKHRFLSSFDMVFCDCDGVIFKKFRDAIPGSADAIAFLRDHGKQVVFVTNNSLSPIVEFLQKFECCGLTVTKQDVIHPAQSVCDHLKSINFEGLIYCLATTAFKNLLKEEGFQLAEEKNLIIAETVHDLRAAIYNTEPVKAVVIDVDFNLTAAKLMRAHTHLKDPDCLFIGGAADTLIPFGGCDIIGPGAFISIVEKSSKRQALLLGKPGKGLSKILKDRFQLENSKRALFIGDSLTSDVRFGNLCGFQTLLVLSGSTVKNDLAEIVDNMETPDYVAQCLEDLIIK